MNRAVLLGLTALYSVQVRLAPLMARRPPALLAARLSLEASGVLGCWVSHGTRATVHATAT